ncbi:hypothetical protein SELMODRAFT_402580 [Selaginella moellendorffii]|uniref:Myb-like domain-containing protein n=1 Tax=Selaginella moellendorffii TaxID=88036 RepID=D8QR48_SELML|nr:trihelix transcription factor ASR3 [Selaginella moellendorffii]XP_002967337.1 trihelix transcription factor ASR3 [Selaginella moellendorffii]EFJ31936.1 hypothetical protein SELMODRAFT_408289 [Selaginella moellendorffii]EFJ37918.1 hypothetical protein SELMODRAFT_402580 [Selaginella moellendorffii]|eukprot:XP_002960379.1 trihelix transcription factor ASR3 [Selaginella moellendorffii]
MAADCTAIIPFDEAGEGSERPREYRKGNWTFHETMILITAKKLDDERRAKGGDKRGKCAEYRWKWVENYCWKNGCQRSQNQCNDKWDNLLRDYKKVRDYETKIQPGQQSYWQLEKHERKERGLPSSLMIQIYDALHDIVDKRLPSSSSRLMAASDKAHTTSYLPLPPQSTASRSSGSSEQLGDPKSPAKKRKSSSRDHHQQDVEGLAPAVARSASDLSHTLMQCEEKKDRRHKDLLSVEERKLMLEETKTEISRQGIEGLVGAVNNLANAILTLASERGGSGE